MASNSDRVVYMTLASRSFYLVLLRARFIVVIFLTVSCLPEPLDVETMPGPPEELVISTQIVRDRSLLVSVTRTFGALDASDDSNPQALLDSIAVNDATVTVDGPSGKTILRPLGNGAYGGVSIPFKAGEVYNLFVKSNSLGEIHATTEVKPKVEFDDVKAELFYTGFDDTLAQVTYTFNDPKESKNWYMVTVQEIEQEDVLENILNPRAFTLMLPDDGFNGQLYAERFRVFPRDYHEGDTIAVSLSNISEAYYQFMKLRIDNRFSLVELVSEPVDYPSNIVGGRGYFNLYIPDVRVFVLE